MSSILGAVLLLLAVSLVRCDSAIQVYMRSVDAVGLVRYTVTIPKVELLTFSILGAIENYIVQSFSYAYVFM